MSHTVATRRESSPVFSTRTFEPRVASSAPSDMAPDDDAFVPLVFTEYVDTRADRTRRTVRRWVRRMRRSIPRITIER